jgi:hypothetical protein
MPRRLATASRSRLDHPFGRVAVHPSGRCREVPVTASIAAGLGDGVRVNGRAAVGCGGSGELRLGGEAATPPGAAAPERPRPVSLWTSTADPAVRPDDHAEFTAGAAQEGRSDLWAGRFGAVRGTLCCLSVVIRHPASTAPHWRFPQRPTGPRRRRPGRARAAPTPPHPAAVGRRPPPHAASLTPGLTERGPRDPGTSRARPRRSGARAGRRSARAAWSTASAGRRR